MIGVYKITNPKGSIYVGSSIHIDKRWKQYKYANYGDQHKIQNSILKYGYESHSFEILCHCSKDELLEKEAYYCSLYNVLDRSNMNLVIPKKGDVKIAYSSEVKEKISKVHKGKKLSNEHRKSLITYWIGKKQTSEHIEKRKMCGCKNPMYGIKGELHHNYGKKFPENAKRMSIERKGTGLLGDNGNAKKIINIETNKVYNSAKEVAILLNMNYSTLKAQLQGYNKNKTKYEYYEKVNPNSK